MQTNILIDQYIKKFKEQMKNENIPFDYRNKEHMYKLGKLILSNVPKICETRKQNGREFNYVAWKWYVYILRKFDKDMWFNINFADQYRVETLLIWDGKESLSSYGVDAIALKRETKEPVNTISEQTVNEGMRCFAKHASLKTGLFWHLWIEGDFN